MAGVYPLKAMLIAHCTQSRPLGVKFLLAVVLFIGGGWAIGLACLGNGVSRRDHAIQRLQTAMLEGDEAAFTAQCFERPSALTQADLEDALRMAAIYGNRSAVTRLLAAGVDPNAPDDRGNTPLMMLAICADSVPMARQLIDAGADVNASDDYGRTALMKDIGVRQAETVRFLLERGAKVQPIDQRGESALTEALRSGDVAVIGLIDQAIEKSHRRAKSEVGKRIG